MRLDDAVLMDRLLQVAAERFDGHLTILKFTTNWRVSFETPEDRDHIASMAVGATFAEAAHRALSVLEEETNESV